ncbi:MAG TPA: hypothetical protein PLT45_03630 [Smithella sp.]|nr:hypothetical protein [Smithella sp.]
MMKSIDTKMKRMRQKIIFSLSLLLPFGMMLLYVWLTATELPLRDDIYVIADGPIKAFLNGTLAFSDLWRASDGQRFLGYNLFLLASAKWFSLSYKALALLIPFFVLFAAVLLYREYRESLLPQRSPEFIAATFFILSFIIFNVIQWESLIFGYALAYQSSMPFFILSFVTLEVFIAQGGIKNYAAALIATALAFLVFSGKLYIVFLPALGCTFLCYILTRRAYLTRKFWHRSVSLVFLLAVIGLIYFYKIQENDYVSDQVFYAAEIFADPFHAAQFFLASFGASVIGVDVFFSVGYLSFPIMVMMGLFIVFFYIVAIVLFISSRMYEKTYLPFFLIMLTLFYLVFMTFRRFGLGMDYGMASRFTYISLYGLAAISWIFIFVLSTQKKPKTLETVSIFAALSIMLTGLLMTSLIVWHVQPARQDYFMKLYDIVMRVDTATDEELLNIGVWPEQVRSSLKLLREHNLNVYRKQQAAGK